MERELDFEACPELTVDHMRAINLRFEPYIFYETTRAGDKDCWCTSCNEHFVHPVLNREMDREYLDILYARHNQYEKCPKCGRTVQYKNMGKAKQRKNLHETTPAVFILPAGDNRVYIRAFFATKDYRSGLTPEVRLSETARYMLMPGEAVMWKYIYDYTHLGIGLNGKARSESFELQKNPLKEPVTGYFNQWTYSYVRGYEVVGRQEIKNTFLRYCQLDEFEEHLVNTVSSQGYQGYIDIPMVKYLCHYAQAPQIEMMMKLGFTNIVFERVLNSRPNKRLINWDGKTPAEVFKMSKQDFNLFHTAGGDLELLRLYNNLKKRKIPRTFAECGRMLNLLGSDYCSEMLTAIFELGINLTHMCNYLEKQASNKSEAWRDSWVRWRDYIQNAKKLSYDLKSQTVLLPKNLKKAHDDSVKNVEWKDNESKRQAMDNLQPSRVKQYHYENDEFIIRTPVTMQEIINEGKALQHCVGGYASRHAEGKLTILFMRRKDQQDKPLYTIEMDGRKMKQVHGAQNCLLKTASEKVFFDEWLAWVSAGSKRQRKREREKVSA